MNTVHLSVGSITNVHCLAALLLARHVVESGHHLILAGGMDKIELIPKPIQDQMMIAIQEFTEMANSPPVKAMEDFHLTLPLSPRILKGHRKHENKAFYNYVPRRKR